MSEFLYSDLYGDRESHYPDIDEDYDDDARSQIPLQINEQGYATMSMRGPLTYGQLREMRAEHVRRAEENGMEFVIATETDVVDVTNRMALDIMFQERDIQVANRKAGEEYIPPAFVSLMNGANPWMATLGRELNKQGFEHYFGGFEPISINLSRFGDSQSGDKKVRVKKPLVAEDAAKIQGKRLYLIDDLVDEGHTLEATETYIAARLKRLGMEPAEQMFTVVLGHKGIAEKEPDFYGMMLPVVWVTGWGCDSNGNYRYSDLLGVSAYQDPEQEEKIRNLYERRQRKDAERAAARAATQSVAELELAS